MLLLHGTADTCALVSNATQFAKALREAGAEVRQAWHISPWPRARRPLGGLIMRSGAAVVRALPAAQLPSLHHICRLFPCMLGNRSGLVCTFLLVRLAVDNSGNCICTSNL